MSQVLANDIRLYFQSFFFPVPHIICLNSLCKKNVIFYFCYVLQRREFSHIYFPSDPKQKAKKVYNSHKTLVCYYI